MQQHSQREKQQDNQPETQQHIDVVTPTNTLFANNICVYQTTIGKQDTADGYGKQNIAFHVSDFAKSVHHNRQQLLESLAVSHKNQVTAIHYLTQVHGKEVVVIDDNYPLGITPKHADAFITQQKGVALAIMTADCLPIVLADEQGREVAVIHAGWQGLAEGVIEATVAKMMYKPTQAWIGCAIKQENFEVGHLVFDAFTKQDPSNQDFFIKQAKTEDHTQNSENYGLEPKWLADLSGIATRKLTSLDITTEVYSECSYGSEDFYSHRQASHKLNTAIGRMATIVFIKTLGNIHET